MDANRLDPPYGMWSHPAINKLATLTFVCTELTVSMCCCWTVGAQQEGRSFLLLPLSVPSSPPHSLSFSPTSSALESAVHLAPQIASDSRAISSRRFELNWSEQYHLCLLEGRCGSSCCSAERNWEEGEVWWGRKERARRGVKKKAATCNHQSLCFTCNLPSWLPCEEGLAPSRAGCSLLSLSFSHSNILFFFFYLPRSHFVDLSLSLLQV